MDLNDSFTETLLQRSKTRREYLNTKMNETSCTVGRKRTALNDRNILEDSSKRQCLDTSESEKENACIPLNKIEEAFVPFKVSSNIQGLAALRKQVVSDTCQNVKTFSAEGIHDPEVNKQEIHFSSTNDSHPSQRRRLTNLAAQINQWEEDLHQPMQSSNNVSSSLSKKANTSSVCNLSNSIAFKLYYTDKFSTSHNLGVRTVSPHKKCGMGSELGCSSMPLVLVNGNIDSVGGSSSKTKVVLSVKASMQESKERAISLTKPLNVSKNEGVKNYNSDGVILDKKETIRKEEVSRFSFEPNENSEPAALPLAARKAIFENAATINNGKSSEPAFQPKLSVAQRAAMFENAAKGNYRVKPQVKLALPKRFVPSVPNKTFEVNVQEDLQKDSSIKGTFTSNMQSSEAASATFVESILLSNDDIHPTLNLTEHMSVENIVSSPQKPISDNVFDLPQQNESNSEENVTDSIPTHVQQHQFEIDNSNSSHQLHIDTFSTQQQFSEDEDSNAQQKLVQNDSSENDSSENGSSDSPQKCMKNTAPLQNTVSSGSAVSQQRFSENSTAESLQGEVMSEDVVYEKERSCLVTPWEKLSSSSSFGNSNSEEEPSNRQSEKPSVYAYVSEDEHADYESELESEYNAAESTSEYNDEVSISGSKIEESEKDSSLADLEDDTMEQDVFIPVGFSAEARLPHFDVETDSFPVTDDEIGSCHMQNGQRKVNDNTYPTDDISLKSAISETSLCNESSSNHKIPRNLTHSSSGSIGPDEVEESAEKKEAPFRASGSSVGSPLVHTVSFYRKQKQGSRSSPIVATKRPHSPAEEDNNTQRIQQQIKLLQEEIVRQQTVIGQTSQALNLCHSTAEFSGSSEQIEAERLLLIATQKRQASINEIQRLKSQSSQVETLVDGTGTLIITDLQLPLKRDFIASQLKGEISSVHCFLCLIRHGPQVIVTQMVSTSDKITGGSLCFSNHIKLQNLSPDFSIVFEVYTLQTSKENLPHDKKYHIKREHSKLRLNSKGKKVESKLLLPAISSPGGPNAVRSPSFAVIGYTRFTVQNCSKKCFTLDKVPFTSPLEGILKVKLHLQAEHNTSEKGFLTRFEDVGGYGLWHRLWCSLDSHQLAYWKYPDEEHQKKPMGTIDLRQCVTGQVRPVSRDVCARPNTFLMVTVCQMKEGNGNTLVTECVDGHTTTRHLLSADTKEERVMWCNKLNEALSNVRKWDVLALRPEDQK